MLNENVIDRMVQACLDRVADPGHGWGKLEERWGSIGWMPVDWVAVLCRIAESDVGISCYEEPRDNNDLPSSFIWPCTATSRGTSPPVSEGEHYFRKRTYRPDLYVA